MGYRDIFIAELDKLEIPHEETREKIYVSMQFNSEKDEKNVFDNLENKWGSLNRLFHYCFSPYDKENNNHSHDFWGGYVIEHNIEKRMDEELISIYTYSDCRDFGKERSIYCVITIKKGA